VSTSCLSGRRRPAGRIARGKSRRYTRRENKPEGETRGKDLVGKRNLREQGPRRASGIRGERWLSTGSASRLSRKILLRAGGQEKRGSCEETATGTLPSKRAFPLRAQGKDTTERKGPRAVQDPEEGKPTSSGERNEKNGAPWTANKKGKTYFNDPKAHEEGLTRRTGKPIIKKATRTPDAKIGFFSSCREERWISRLSGRERKDNDGRKKEDA